MTRRCAVVGTGQTRHGRRRDVSVAGLVGEAASIALADAGVDRDAIDAVVLGSGPDALEGVMMPELSLAEALGAVGKPVLRVQAAGSGGASAAITAATLVESGLYETVLAVGYEKHSDGSPSWALSPGGGVGSGTGAMFAPWVREYRRRSDAPDHVGWAVAVKDRLNGARNPNAHLKLPHITVDAVAQSPILWDPIRRLEAGPISDGAAAMVLTSEQGVERLGSPPAWVLAHARRAESVRAPNRDPVRPAAAVECAGALYAAVGITDPRGQIDCAELSVPFSWYEPIWLEAHLFAGVGEGWRLSDEGVTGPDGDLPVNMSGGVLCTNPMGASGMLRCLESVDQVRGRAGDHQVDGASVALAQAFGGAVQHFAMWIVSDRPELG